MAHLLHSHTDCQCITGRCEGTREPVGSCANTGSSRLENTSLAYLISMLVRRFFSCSMLGMLSDEYQTERQTWCTRSCIRSSSRWICGGCACCSSWITGSDIGSDAVVRVTKLSTNTVFSMSHTSINVLGVSSWLPFHVSTATITHRPLPLTGCTAY